MIIKSPAWSNQTVPVAAEPGVVRADQQKLCVAPMLPVKAWEYLVSLSVAKIPVKFVETLLMQPSPHPLQPEHLLLHLWVVVVILLVLLYMSAVISSPIQHQQFRELMVVVVTDLVILTILVAIIMVVALVPQPNHRYLAQQTVLFLVRINQ